MLAIKELSSEQKEFLRNFYNDENVEYVTDFDISNSRLDKPMTDKNKFDEVLVLEQFSMKSFDPFESEDMFLHPGVTFPEGLKDKYIEQLITKFHVSDKSFYTTISPQMFRCTIIELGKIINTFLKYGTRQDLTTLADLVEIIQNYEINDKHKDDDYYIEDSSIDIRQEGYDVCVVRETPIKIKSYVNKNKNKRNALLLPIKNLYKEIGGDVDINVDNYEISVKLSLPKQTDKVKTHEDDVIYACNLGCAAIDFTPKNEIDDSNFEIFTIQQEHSSPFNLKIQKEGFSSDIQRDELTEAVSFMKRFSNNNLIEEAYITTYKYLNLYDEARGIKGGGNIEDRNCLYIQCKNMHSKLTKKDDADITIAIRYLNDYVNDTLCKLITSVNSAEIYVFERIKPYVASQMFAELQRVINLANNLSDNGISLNIDNDNIEIRDSNNKLIVKATYQSDKESFVGCCHSPKLTDKVIKIIKDIQQIQPEQTMSSYKLTKEFILSELKNRNIKVNDRFSHEIGSSRYFNRQNINEYYKDLISYLENSYVQIEELDDGQIIIESLSLNNAHII